MPVRRSRSNRRQRQRGGAGLDITRDATLEKQGEDINADAAAEGVKLLHAWLDKREQNGINEILALFDNKGEPDNEEIFPGKKLKATAFNDLYKWTMLPVVRKLESLKGGDITVTFGIDLRDEKMRNALREGKGPGEAFENEMNPLESRIHNALKNKLAPRKFDKDLFKYVLTGPRATILNVDNVPGAQPATINAICDKPLIDAVKDYGVEYNHTSADFNKDNVVVSFYYKPKVADNNGVMGSHFIEATGPWHRVTWLETSMMQTVYEAKLKHDLNVDSDPTAYGKWLYVALLRCAKSVAYTRMVQRSREAAWTSSQLSKIPGVPPPMTPALFTGRRTGGLAFILLQNLFHADHFKFINPAEPMPSVEAGDGKTYSLGTSSCDANYILSQKLKGPDGKFLRCLPPAGTHAHELSMVTSILFPDLDQKLPATTQLIGHYLYAKYVWLKSCRAGPLPMLPDTLGTRVFLRAANKYTVPDLRIDSDPHCRKVPFIDLVLSGRQDSGALKDFRQNMLDGNYVNQPNTAPRGMMASEIDDTQTLSSAAEMGYASFGAGGFFGDSEKVWNTSADNKSYGSMAVKAVRVLYKKDIDVAGIPYMETVGDLLVGYPVKIGDAKNYNPVENGNGPPLPPGSLSAKDKLSIDKNKRDDFVARVKDWASSIRVAAGKPNEPITFEPIMPFSDVFDETTPTGRPAGAPAGGRRSRRNNRSSRRSSRRNNRRY